MTVYVAEINGRAIAAFNAFDFGHKMVRAREPQELADLRGSPCGRTSWLADQELRGNEGVGRPGAPCPICGTSAPTRAPGRRLRRANERRASY
jgi:hypothetical protein